MVGSNGGHGMGLMGVLGLQRGRVKKPSSSRQGQVVQRNSRNRYVKKTSSSRHNRSPTRSPTRSPSRSPSLKSQIVNESSSYVGWVPQTKPQPTIIIPAEIQRQINEARLQYLRNVISIYNNNKQRKPVERKKQRKQSNPRSSLRF